MSTSNTGGQAFPQSWHDSHGTYWEHGMTLRDYFAAKAMEGMFAGDAGDPRPCLREHFHLRAETAYCMADAMLKAREA